LKKAIPAGITTVSESGIHNTENCDLLNANGFDAILVGESLMRQANPGQAIVDLLGANR
ncbi:MAG: indole-3-glycerol-phosphate synthase TrpC, partial [Proteobacteria bacterium]|nr:indole-3-glycerol-phosphate synthase TrpC [Pseudomonadota bacterium]